VKEINYRFFHWGPFLYQTDINKKEINEIKNLCSKKNKDYRENLAGIIKHEYQIDHEKMSPIIAPYIKSYLKGFENYTGKCLGSDFELVNSWVNYMTKFESNPMHTHGSDLSFVVFTKIPKELIEEYNKHSGNTKPGYLNFTYTLNNRKELLDLHSFFPKVGQLFIFPACLHHDVTGFTCDGERVSVSGNIKITN